MTNMRPPALATWLLKHAARGNDALVGDLEAQAPVADVAAQDHGLAGEIEDLAGVLPRLHAEDGHGGGSLSRKVPAPSDEYARARSAAGCRPCFILTKKTFCGRRAQAGQAAKGEPIPRPRSQHGGLIRPGYDPLRDQLALLVEPARKGVDRGLGEIAVFYGAL